MRGLKLVFPLKRVLLLGRIFYRCVDWNLPICKGIFLHFVASFTDAWIETPFHNRDKVSLCRIFYRCVDWNIMLFAWLNQVVTVASFTDAWIETSARNPFREKFASHLLQMRGLKLRKAWAQNRFWMSHLLQMRGLKLGNPTAYPILSSRIFYRCVDWNWGIQRLIQFFRVASFTDAWIETVPSPLVQQSFVSHLLQMRGLKPKSKSPVDFSFVASFTDAWIETYPINF